MTMTPQRQKRRAWCIAAASAATLMFSTMAHTADTTFPERPLTLVSPFATGGTSDTVARAAARFMEQDLGRPVVVENKPGAGGTIGVGSILLGEPDGYSMVMGGLGSIVFPAVVYRQSLRFDPAKDLVPLGVLGVAPTVILVRSDFPANNLQELIAYAKANPGQVSYGSAGVGGALHMAGVLFERQAGVSLNHVPYKGGAPAMTDLAGGTVDMAFADLTLARSSLASGRVKALAVASQERLAALPDTPTTAESGLTGTEVDTWYAVFAPAGTPPERLARLRQAVDTARQNPALTETLLAQAIVPVDTPLASFEQALATDYQTWLPLLEQVCAESGCN